MNSFSLIVGFIVLVVTLLALDLGVFNRKAHEVSIGEAFKWSLFWIAVGLAFGGVVYALQGSEKAALYYTAYVIEKSLSVDNLFVFVLIFQAYKVPNRYQHRVLFWGIIGALVMRAVFVIGGVSLINRFGILMYPFGAFLIYAGIKTGIKALKDEEEEAPSDGWIHGLLKRFGLPVTSTLEGQKIFTRISGTIYATPLFVVLLLIEASDLLFAVDSVPAVIAVTPDAFIAYASNVFAILGLRSIYFVLAASMKKFRFLAWGLSAILVLVGAKMIVGHAGMLHVDSMVTLFVVCGILATSVVASLLFPNRTSEPKLKVVT